MENAKNDNNPEKKPPFRIQYALAWALFLFILLDIALRVFFARPGLALRNLGINTHAMPYLLEQIQKSRASTKIAWLGASVMQGLRNVNADQTYPYLTDRLLQDQGEDVEGFNLAVAGANLGDALCLMHASVDRGVTVVPVAVHYRHFATKGTLGKQVLYPENLVYLQGLKDRYRLRTKVLGVTPRDWNEIGFDSFVQSFWALYRHRGLIWQLASDSERDPMETLGHEFKNATGLVDDRVLAAENLTIEDRNADSIWKELPLALRITNKASYMAVDFSEANPRWAVVDRMCKDARAADVVLLFFFSPLNREAIEQFDMFPWRQMQVFRNKFTKRVVNNGQLVADMSEAVDSRFFTDFEHLNLNGHKQLAKELAPQILQAIELAERGDR